ncbi:unnamed protein product [Durusdinium trenchii]|uniref:Uncharacterized protein n=1 Tax=Durusdinium trenchii TaxID=1381693 RepID=A0ABP0PZJ6_9DINO
MKALRNPPCRQQGLCRHPPWLTVQLQLQRLIVPNSCVRRRKSSPRSTVAEIPQSCNAGSCTWKGDGLKLDEAEKIMAMLRSLVRQGFCAGTADQAAVQKNRSQAFRGPARLQDPTATGQNLAKSADIFTAWFSLSWDSGNCSQQCHIPGAGWPRCGCKCAGRPEAYASKESCRQGCGRFQEHS